MKKKFAIPEELIGTFNRLMNLVPDELKDDANTQKTISVYLKLGGEKLARHGINIIKNRFQTEGIKDVPQTVTSDEPLNDKTQDTDPDSPDIDDFEFPSE